MTRLSRAIRPMSWTYALGEELLIVIGVSIALGVSAWNERRLDRIAERDYLCRLYEDFSNDVGRLDGFAARLERKAVTLRDLLSETDDSLMDRDSTSFAEDLARSATVSLTWIQTATFDDLRSTGNLALIRNANIRAALAQYFRRYELMYEILDEPVGSYRQILAGAVPGPAIFDQITNDIAIERSDLLRGLQNLRSHSDFESAVNAELNYTASLLKYTREFGVVAEELTMRLSTEIVGDKDHSDISAKCTPE